MKKILLFVVAIAAMWCVSCSKDDDDKDPLNGEGGEGVITFLTNPRHSNTYWLFISSLNKGDVITIDWGDGTSEKVKTILPHDYDDSYTTESIRHEYSDEKHYQVIVKGNIYEFSTEQCEISSLDVSKCPKLVKLCCAVSSLTSLDVSKNTALTYLWCSSNNLTSLDVSGCSALTELRCSSNNLTSLDVSKNTALTELSCSDNNLTSLDVSNNTALTELSCSDNNLTSLDVSGCSALTELWCYNNNLTSLDVSGCTALTELLCRDNDLSASAINKIFNDLPQGKYDEYGKPSKIYIYCNPGSKTCDTSIAENKGWSVINP